MVGSLFDDKNPLRCARWRENAMMDRTDKGENCDERNDARHKKNVPQYTAEMRPKMVGHILDVKNVSNVA
jgi:hypothetical protein